MKNIKPWPYAKLTSPNDSYSSAMRLDGDHYYRDYGAWGVHFEVKGNRIFAKSRHPFTKHLDGLEFIQITKKEWAEENGK